MAGWAAFDRFVKIEVATSEVVTIFVKVFCLVSVKPGFISSPQTGYEIQATLK